MIVGKFSSSCCSYLALEINSAINWPGFSMGSRTYYFPKSQMNEMNELPR
jgi:hypothetical protein